MKLVYPEPGTNISNHVKIRKGDIGKAWAQCDVIAEDSFTIPQSDHIALEPRNVRCEIKPDGRVIFYTSSQSPFIVRKLIARYFNIDEGKVIVNKPRTAWSNWCKRCLWERGLRCVYCTPSFIMNSHALVTIHPDANDEITKSI